MEAWAAVRACWSGKHKLLQVRWVNGRYEFQPSADKDLQDYMMARSLLEKRVPRLSKLLAKFDLI